jgi:hypothetical protein
MNKVKEFGVLLVCIFFIISSLVWLPLMKLHNIWVFRIKKDGGSFEGFKRFHEKGKKEWREKVQGN